jgi:hypothetical protein
VVFVVLIDDLRGGLRQGGGCEDEKEGREERVAEFHDHEFGTLFEFVETRPG